MIKKIPFFMIKKKKLITKLAGTFFISKKKKVRWSNYSDTHPYFHA